MILVTGASGTVGSELVQQLLAMRQPMRVLTRDVKKLAHLTHQTEVVVGSLDQPSTLDAIMQGVTRIFLVTFETQQDINIIQAAKRAGVQQIVKLSTMEADPAKIQIGKWHREREQLIEASGIDWTFLRPSMFMSNTIEWWADSIKQQSAVYFPGGKGTVAAVAPHDVAAVAAAALTQQGHTKQAYTLTGPQLHSMGEMVNIIGKTLGKPLRYASIPQLAAKLWLMKNGMDKTMVNALMEVMTILSKNEGALVTDTVQHVTGRVPHSFEAWCRQHSEAFR